MLNHMNTIKRSATFVFCHAIVILPCFMANALEPYQDDLLSHASTSSNDSLFWGTYRSNLYFGMRPRSPESLMTGLVWFGVQDYASVARPRHSCEQDDGLTFYGWTKHDGRSGGSQLLQDSVNNVEITTEFLKVPGGSHGGSWGARIKGRPLDQGRPMRVSFLPYFGIEGSGSLELENADDDEGIEGAAKFTGHSQDLGDFTLTVNDGGTGDQRFRYLGVSAPAGQIWKAKDHVLQDISSNVQDYVEKNGRENFPDPATLLLLSNELRFGSNLFVLQRVYNEPFELDIYFDSGSMPSKLDAFTLSRGLEAFKASYDDRFESTFGLSDKGYDPSEIDFARTLTSSMVGGISYFHGSSIVDRSFAHTYDDSQSSRDDEEGGGRDADPRVTDPMALFTATPSRSFFPRGFYWDEGFHLAIIGSWDQDLSLDILKSWISLIDKDGWVAREQILGEEARSKVPQQFWTQYPHYANPPTLTMAVTDFIARLRRRGVDIADAKIGRDAEINPMSFGIAPATSDTLALANRHLDSPPLAKAYLLSIYPSLRRHYNWFRKTQRGQIAEWGRKATSRTEAYRWRGRTEDHVLTSGLDDYPRARPPHTGELHLDLICWMGFFTRTMRDIADYVGEAEDLSEYEHLYDAILANIDDLHWNEDQKMYCDASVDEDDESFHVCHKGYVSLFPLFLGLVSPQSPRLGHLLDMLHDPDHLWSPYGIRSLSIKDAYFGEGENYWRGPIWIQMNYFVLQSLHNIYAKIDGPHRQRAHQIYKELRRNVVSNVKKEHDRTGFTWEQYDATTGHGQRSHPFTGWTSLVTLIMAEEY